MMWQQTQFNLLSSELEAVLAPLSNIPRLIDLLKEPLKAPGRGLASFENGRKPWPLLPLVVCESICGEYKKALPAAASMQLFLAAGDVFDDIEDLDNPKSIVAKYGLGLATNVATTLLILAEIELTHITSDENNHNIVPELINDVNEYFKNACIGQHLDISSNLLDNISENYYLDIVNMKSASQFECACKLGAMIATNNQELINLLCQYGRNIGNAMQLGNDIEGVVSKKDILQRKVSLPVIYALSHAAVEERETIRGNFKKVQPAFNPNEIQDLLFRTGAVHYTILKMEHFKQQAKEAVIAANTHGISSERLLWFLD